MVDHSHKINKKAEFTFSCLIQHNAGRALVQALKRAALSVSSGKTYPPGVRAFTFIQ